jgi:uncharacterized alkaline shock family protein YloU
VSEPYVIREPAGTITVAPGVLSQVVIGAAESVAGARARRPRRGLELAVDGDRARVSLELAVRYGEVLPEVAREVQRRVRDALRAMCGLDLAAVDVSVEEVDR